MATVVNSFREQRGKYPWHEWTDGRIWIIKHGEDFKCSVTTMRGAVYKHAEKRGMYARIQLEEDGLRIQFLPRAPKKRLRLRPRIKT